MRIAYGNVSYRLGVSGGGNAHIGQFITQATALGHEIWSWQGNQHPSVQLLSSHPLTRIAQLRTLDAICVRIEDRLPDAAFSRWAIAPYKPLIGSPIIVWEFNTVPEFGRVLGRSDVEIQQSIEALRRYGRGCDLAVCVSQKLAEYVGDRLGIQRVLTIPNGSDPDLFRPDVPPVKRIRTDANMLNVVWIGSGHLSWHDLDLLRDTAQIVSQQDKPIEFHIIGFCRPVMREMPANVHYHGSEEYALLPQWLSAMQVGLCLYRPGPADYSSPLKLFDYMASGLAVVGTPQPQMAEIFAQLGQLDLMVPHGDAVALAQVLTDLSQNRKRVQELGQRGRQLVMEEYNWRRVVRETVGAIASLRDTHTTFIGNCL